MLGLMWHGAIASNLTTTVVDPSGQRLQHAVVSLHTNTPLRAAADTRQAMDQRARQFAPHVLAIQQGTLVSFPNSDDVRHHVYSFSTPNQFEIKLYHGEASEPVFFDDPGIVVLGCNIHDGMVGYLRVLDTPWFGSTKEDGIAAIENVPNGQYTLQIWHPDMGMRIQYQPIVINNNDMMLPVTINTEVNAQVFDRSTRPIDPLQALFRND